MARKPPSIAEQVRAALDSVFGRKRQAPRRKKRKPGRAPAQRKKRAPAPPPPKRKTCGVCGEVGHNARRHRAEPSPPVAPVPAHEEPRRRGPRRCTICGELGHDRRICPKRGTDGGDSAQEPNMEPPAPAPPPEEPDITGEDGGTSTHFIPHGSTGGGRGRGRRTCRRCHQPGHNVSTCELDLTEARLQDIAAACVLLGLSAAPTRSPLPVKETPPEPEADRPTYDREDLDAIAAMAPDLPEPPSPPPPPAEPKPERLVRVSDIKDRHRAHTIRSPQRLTREERRAGEQLEAPREMEMPLTRAECQADPGRPCPWVRCKAHLYLDVNPKTGAIKLNHPNLEVWEMAESCSNDVADRGPHTLEQVGALVNLTRERVRQLEVGAARNREAKKIAEDVEFVDHDDESPIASAIG